MPRPWRSGGCLAVLVALGSPCAGQQQISAHKFVVASGHAAATQAGLEVLRRGGNVIDAAITTSLVLGVALPYGSGVGGKMVMLYRDAASGRVHCIEASCAAPAGLKLEAFRQLSLEDRRFGYTAAGVPALPAGLWAAHRRWGTIKWPDLVAPAVAVAEQGVEMTEDMCRLCAPDVWTMRDDPEAARLYLTDGEALAAGAVLQNLDLAATLRRLAELGRKGFYEGETAERIVAAATAHGSPMTLKDLRNYRAKIVDPFERRLPRSSRLHQPAAATGRIDGAVGAQGPGTARLAGSGAARRRLHQHDEPRPAERLPARGSLHGRRARRQPRRSPLVDRRFDRESLGGRRHGRSDARRAHEQRVFETTDDLVDASTAHLTIADSQGNIVSLTQSLSFHFGAGVVVPGTGILLNNSLSNFSTSTDSINCAAGGKWPRSTVAPIIVTKDDAPVMAFGIPGGQRIPTTSIQLMVDVLDFKQSLTDAFAQPRFHIRRPVDLSQPANLLDLEGATPKAMARSLVAAGWQLVNWQPDGRYFGGGNAVCFEPDGTLLGVADGRRNNQAIGE